MQKILPKILDSLWPKRCINCGREGAYLCDDCFALIDISREPPRPLGWLNGLYYAASYENRIVQSAIHLLKYGYIKELSENLASLIIAHFKLLDKPAAPADLLCAVPLHKSKLKQRGFNQAEEIAKHLSKFLNIPLLPKALRKTKKTLPQTALRKEERTRNIIGAFAINAQKKNQIVGKKILLVDDVLTTGTTLQECAKVLKQNQALKVFGVVVARG